MAWKIRITDEAKRDFAKLEKSIQKQVLAGIIKVSKAPLPSPDGYGKPLGNKYGNNLTGFFKIKYKGIGIIFKANTLQKPTQIIITGKNNAVYAKNGKIRLTKKKFML